MECGSCPACKVAGLDIHKNIIELVVAAPVTTKLPFISVRCEYEKRKIEIITHCPRGCNTVLRKEIERKICTKNAVPAYKIRDPSITVDQVHAIALNQCRKLKYYTLHVIRVTNKNVPDATSF